MVETEWCIVEIFSVLTDGTEDTDSDNGPSVVEFKAGKPVEFG